MALNKGIGDPTPRVTNTKGANLKSSIVGHEGKGMRAKVLDGVLGLG